MANDNVLSSSSQVVSSKVLGSSNPILRKFGKIGAAFQGVGCGFLAVIASFVLIWMSINGVEERSKIVASLELKQASNSAQENGLVKLQGKVNLAKSADFSINHCADSTCAVLTDNTTAIKNNMYYSVAYQRFEVVKEVKTEYKTRTENGQEIEDKIETTTYKEDWVEKTKATNWAEFTLEGIKIQPQKAELIVNEKSQTIENIKIPNFSETLQNYGQSVSGKIGSMRAVVNYYPAPLENMIIVGSKDSSGIASGNPFLITEKSEADLVKHLQDAENTQRIFFVVAAWIACLVGFSMILAPIIELIDWIPLFGNAAKAVAGFISFVLATGLVLLSYTFIRFWYVFVIIAVLLIALAIFLVVRSANNKPVTK